MNERNIIEQDTLFLIFQYLNNCTTCTSTSNTLKKELEENNLLGVTYKWDGSTRNKTLSDYTNKYQNIPSNEIIELLKLSIHHQQQQFNNDNNNNNNNNNNNTITKFTSLLDQPKSSQLNREIIDEIKSIISRQVTLSSEQSNNKQLVKKLQKDILKDDLKDDLTSTKLLSLFTPTTNTTTNTTIILPSINSLSNSNNSNNSNVTTNDLINTNHNTNEITDILKTIGKIKYSKHSENLIEEKQTEMESFENEKNQLKEYISLNYPNFLLSSRIRGVVDNGIEWLMLKKLGKQRYGPITPSYFNYPQINSITNEITLRPHPSPESMLINQYHYLWSTSGHLLHPAYCAVFDRTGRYVITGADDYLVKIWDTETALLVKTCRGHTGYITVIAVSYDNSLFATACTAGSIRIWRLSDGKCLSLMEHNASSVNWLQFDYLTGSLLSAGDDGQCIIWDLSCYIPFNETNCYQNEIDYQEGGKRWWVGDLSIETCPLIKCCLTTNLQSSVPSSSSLSSSITTTKLQLLECGIFSWNKYKKLEEKPGCLSLPHIKDGLSGEIIKIITFDISSLDNIIATGCEDGIARIWRFNDNTVNNNNNNNNNGDNNNLNSHIDEITKAKKIDNLLKLQKMKNILSSTDYVKLETTTMYLITRLEGHMDEVTDVKFSHVGDRLCTSSLKDGTVRIWGFSKNFIKIESIILNMNDNEVDDLDSNNGNNNSNRNNNNNGNNQLPRQRGRSLRSDNLKAHIFNISWTCDDQFILITHSIPIKKSSRSNNNNNNNNHPTRIRIYDSLSGKLCHSFIISQQKTNVLSCHPLNPTIIFTGGEDGYMNVWNIERGILIFQHRLLSPPNIEEIMQPNLPVEILDATFSPDGLRIVVSDAIGRTIVLGRDNSEKYFNNNLYHEQYFSTDYATVVNDAIGWPYDEGTQLPLHLAPIGPLVDMSHVQYHDQPKSKLCLPFPIKYHSIYNDWKNSVQNLRNCQRIFHLSYLSMKKAKNRNGTTGTTTSSSTSELLLTCKQSKSHMNSNFKPSIWGNSHLVTKQKRDINTLPSTTTTTTTTRLTSNIVSLSQYSPVPQRQRIVIISDDENDNDDDNDENDNDYDESESDSDERHSRRRNRSRNNSTRNQNNYDNNNNNSNNINNNLQRRNLRSGRIIRPSTRYSDIDVNISNNNIHNTRSQRLRRSRSSEGDVISPTLDHQSSRTHRRIQRASNRRLIYDEDEDEDEEDEDEMGDSNSDSKDENSVSVDDSDNEEDEDDEEEEEDDDDLHNDEYNNIQVKNSKKLNKNLKKTNKTKRRSSSSSLNSNDSNENSNKTNKSNKNNNHNKEDNSKIVDDNEEQISLRVYSGWSSIRSKGKYHRIIPIGIEIEREWLMLDAPNDLQYCPQVGDNVMYFPQGHLNYLNVIPEHQRPPWLLFPQKWPVVECKIIKIKYDFPTQSEYKKCASIIAKISLQLIGKPLKWDSNCGPGYLYSSFVPLRESRNSTVQELVFDITLRNIGLPDFIIPSYIYYRCTLTNWRRSIEFISYFQEYNEENVITYKDYKGIVQKVSDCDNRDWISSPWESLEIKWIDSSTLIDENNDYERINPWDAIIPNIDYPSKRYFSTCLSSEFRNYFVNIVENLMNMEEYQPFAYPIDSIFFPDYDSIIPVSIYLDLIKRRLENNYYRQIISLEADIALILTNCEIYNVDDSPIISQAIELCEKLRKAIESNQNTSVFIDSTQSYNTTSALPSISLNFSSNTSIQVENEIEPLINTEPTRIMTRRSARRNNEMNNEITNELSSNRRQRFDANNRHSTSNIETNNLDDSRSNSNFNSNSTTTGGVNHNNSRSSRISNNILSVIENEKDEDNEDDNEVLFSASGRPLRKVQNKGFVQHFNENVYDMDLKSRNSRSQKKMKRTIETNDIHLESRSKRLKSKNQLNHKNKEDEEDEDEEDEDKEEDKKNKTNNVRRSSRNSNKKVRYVNEEDEEDEKEEQSDFSSRDDDKNEENDSENDSDDDNDGEENDKNKIEDDYRSNKRQRFKSMDSEKDLCKETNLSPRISTRSSNRQTSSTSSLTTTTSSLKDQLLSIVSKGEKIDTKQIFHFPVDDDDFPEYCKIIKNPMDFSTLRSNINSGKYLTIKQLKADLMLIYDNCELFNEDGSKIYKESGRQRQLILKFLQKFSV